MTRPRIGSTVIDTTRRELGEGVLQFWTHFPTLGRCARVKFALGLKFVREVDMSFAPRPRYVSREATAEEQAAARRFGLTVRQYREAVSESQ